MIFTFFLIILSTILILIKWWLSKHFEKNNITQSMSRKGNCLDNAIIENFFGTLKSELFYLKKYENVKQLEIDIKNYIYYYNNNSISKLLKEMSPIKYRAQYYK